jgi:hypothetical protein
MERNMFKTTAIAAAIAAFAASSAYAQAIGTITAGLYNVTNQYTALDDTSGLCGASITAGGFSTGVASVFGNGKVLQVINAVPGAVSSGTASGVSNETCNFPDLPAATATSGTITGTISCSLGASTSPSIQLTGGTTVVNSVLPKTTTNTANSFKITQTGVTVSLLEGTTWTPICTVSTDSLYIRTGT